MDAKKQEFSFAKKESSINVTPVTPILEAKRPRPRRRLTLWMEDDTCQNYHPFIFNSVEKTIVNDFGLFEHTPCAAWSCPWDEQQNVTSAESEASFPGLVKVFKEHNIDQSNFVLAHQEVNPDTKLAVIESGFDQVQVLRVIDYEMTNVEWAKIYEFCSDDAIRMTEPIRHSWYDSDHDQIVACESRAELKYWSDSELVFAIDACLLHVQLDEVN